MNEKHDDAVLGGCHQTTMGGKPAAKAFNPDRKMVEQMIHHFKTPYATIKK